MAGSGRPPKPPETRRNRHAPRTGEWVLIPAELERPVLPPLPRRARGDGPWSARTRAAWKAWRADPVTSQYGPADIDLALHAIWLLEACVRDPKPSLAAEVRLLRDSLGLTPKGRQDRRWKVVPATDAEVVELDDARTRRSIRHRLRAIDPTPL